MNESREKVMYPERDTIRSEGDKFESKNLVEPLMDRWRLFKFLKA